MKGYGQLERAQAENTSADPSAGIAGRLTFNNTDGKLTLDNGSVNRKVVTENDTQALTNKTLSGNIATTLVSGAATITLPTVTGTLATLAGSETLTNKVLSGNTASTLINGAATITLPSATGTLATLAGTEALTNKDIDGGAASNARRITLPKDTKANLDALTRKAGTIVYGTDTSAPYIDTGASLVKIITGGVPALNILSKTANYTAASGDDFIKCDATGGAFTISLPAAASNSGVMFRIKKTDSSFNIVTIDPNGAELVDGTTTTTLNTQNEEVCILSNGTSWDLIDRKIPTILTPWTPTIVGAGVYSNLEALWARIGGYFVGEVVFTTGTPSATVFAIPLPGSLAVRTSTSVGYKMAGQWTQDSTTAYHGHLLYASGETSIKASLSIGATYLGLHALNGSSILNGTVDTAMSFRAPIPGWNG